MDKKEIYGYLCYYDIRNPYYVKPAGWTDATPPRENCSCDNCFYSRDRLAIELLKYIPDK